MPLHLGEPPGSSEERRANEEAMGRWMVEVCSDSLAEQPPSWARISATCRAPWDEACASLAV